MVANTLEAKAQALLGHLGPGKLAAVVYLLEVMVQEEEPVTEEDLRRFRDGEAFFAIGKAIPTEDLLAEFGTNPADFPLIK